MAYANDVRSNGFSVFASISALRATLADRLAQRKVYRATVVELSNLSNRELADLGISRSMIKGIALEAAKTAN